MKIFILVFGILLGSFAIVFGEADDSPGLQGLGMILAIFCAFKVFKHFKRKS